MNAAKHEPLTVARTPNPNCLACIEKRRHTPAEFKVYHPNAGTGTMVNK